MREEPNWLFMLVSQYGEKAGVVRVDLNKLLDKLGMETELKENRIVDNRKLVK